MTAAHGDSCSLAGRVAVVTGASGGLGRAISRQFAQSGASLVLAGRSADRLEAVAAPLRRCGAEVLAVPADLSELDDVMRLTEQCQAKFSRIDVLVNNAAHATPLTRAEKISVADWDAVMSVNLRGTFFLTQEIGRTMLENRRGSVINVCSALAETAAPGAAAYSAAKAALFSLTKTLGVEWAKRGVRVNALSPGYIDTEMTAELSADAKAMAWITDRTPMGRMAQPDEIAHAAVFLASEASTYMTGSILTLDGGYTAQ